MRLVSSPMISIMHASVGWQARRRPVWPGIACVAASTLPVLLLLAATECNVLSMFRSRRLSCMSQTDLLRGYPSHPHPIRVTCRHPGTEPSHLSLRQYIDKAGLSCLPQRHRFYLERYERYEAWGMVDSITRGPYTW